MQTFRFHAPLFKYLRYTFNLGILILAIILIPACCNLWEEAQKEAQSISVYDFCKPPSHDPNWHQVFFECDPTEETINKVNEARLKKTIPFVALIVILAIGDIILWYMFFSCFYRRLKEKKSSTKHTNRGLPFFHL